ncbi:MAG TPA: hypothetical protein VHQ39_00115 [Dongiaceae bacterium]|nr:hypothetical protein [Dongiaceae bacterium]
MNFDQFSLDEPGKSSRCAHLDQIGTLNWAGLAARLAATQAARQVLTRWSSSVAGHGVPASGSFASASGSFAPALVPLVSAHLANASRQTEGFMSLDVNQDAKATGNPLGTIASDSKANAKPVAAVRGLK